MRRCRCLLSALCGAIAFFAFVLYPIGLLLRWFLSREGEPSRFDAPTEPECIEIPGHLYRRPDPLIYSQRYLQSQGLAVTWINPDVTIEQGGIPVDPGDLQPGTDYEVIARIWNGSVEAPAIGMPVQFSYLSFGVGTQTHPIGSTTVDLGARGAPGCPAFAHCSWTTPATPGHYCLLIELIWSDDANPLNNIGQSNTQVKKLNSPHAAFNFDLANPDQDRHVYRLVVDAYALPERPTCEGRPKARFAVPPAQEIKAMAHEARTEHDPAKFPVPDDWQVLVDPAEAVLGPGQSRAVTVDVTAPDGFAGSKPFNVHAFDEHGRLAGGVTLTVES